MSDVCVQLGASVDVARRTLFIEPGAALIAVPGSQVILIPAVWAAIRQLAAGHRDEETLGPLDDFQITNHEFIVEGHAAERMETFVVLFDKLDTDFGDFHYRLLWLSLARTNHEN